MQRPDFEPHTPGGCVDLGYRQIHGMTCEHAVLIAEAGTVHHETGLTPREILAQRDELAALCDAILKRLDMEHAEMTANGIGSPAFVNAAMRDDLRAALANTQPEGREG